MFITDKTKLVRWLLCASILVGSAVPGQARDAAGSQMRRSISDYERTVKEGVALGAVLGAGIGAIIGSQRGGQGALGGALLGGLIGGAIGEAGGRSVANNKARQIRREDRLDAQIAHARASNRKLTSLVSVSSNLVNRRQGELAALKRGKGRNEVERQRALLSDLREDRASVDEALRLARRSRNALQSDIANYRSAKALRSEAAKTDNAIARLQKDRAKLDQLIKGAR